MTSQVHPVDEVLPFGKLTALGLQHVLVMYAGDPLYQRMHDRYDQSAAYQAACDLVFKGVEQPSGYTEPLLHAWRLKVKAAAQ